MSEKHKKPAVVAGFAISSPGIVPFDLEVVTVARSGDHVTSLVHCFHIILEYLVFPKPLRAKRFQN
jgi:hypothetical protein